MFLPPDLLNYEGSSQRWGWVTFTLSGLKLCRKDGLIHLTS